ncbi:MAG: hypothetical protein R2798_13685 [Chitinophagales bacterium]|nr:hypothetical protein [Bacteroidota bacterium]MCB9044198.1 hypothetical protein [Chitinophagales bacterium]
MESFVTNWGINIALWLVYIAIGLIVVFFILNAIKNPKSAFKSILSAGVLALFLIIVYFTASDSIGKVFQTASYAYLTPSIMKYVTAGINASVFLLIAALASWVLLEVYNFVK